MSGIRLDNYAAMVGITTFEHYCRSRFGGSVPLPYRILQFRFYGRHICSLKLWCSRQLTRVEKNQRRAAKSDRIEAKWRR